MWGFPKIRGTIFGVPIVRTIVFGGSLGAPLFKETTMSGVFGRGFGQCWLFFRP